ncbi:MAG TPA: YciI family protein [Acidobacteriota bacterium]
MKYMCLIYYDEQNLDSLSKNEFESLVDEALSYDEELQEKGQSLARGALQSIQTATSIRIRNGKTSITDGPFVETKEQLGGIVVIEANDLNEALQIASKLPPARLGGVEVRPIRELQYSNR